MPHCQHPPVSRVYLENSRYNCSACGAHDRICSHPPSARRWFADQSGYDCMLCGKPVRHHRRMHGHIEIQPPEDMLEDVPEDLPVALPDMPPEERAAAIRTSRARSRALDRLRRKFILEYARFFSQELEREEMKAGLRQVPLMPEGEFTVLRKAVAARYATTAELETFRLQMAARRQLVTDGRGADIRGGS